MTSGKRKEIRERRLKKKRQQRITTLLAIVGGSILLIALVAVPNLVDSLKPVGDITPITPTERPMVDGRSMGDPQAPVIVEVFSDFQCPMCKVFADETEMQIATSYVANNKVFYIYRQYPFLDDAVAGKESDQAANASMCAAEQNRFWDYHDLLLANQNGENKGAFNDRRLVAFAETLGLNMDEFNKCFNANTYANEIDADITKATQLGVSGTPTVFVNGVVVKKGFVPSFDDMSSAIDAELAKLGQ